MIEKSKTTIETRYQGMSCLLIPKYTCFFVDFEKQMWEDMLNHHPLKSGRKTFFWQTSDSLKIGGFWEKMRDMLRHHPLKSGRKTCFWQTCQMISTKLATNQQIAPLTIKPETICVRPQSISFSPLARNFSLLSFLRITCWLCGFICWSSEGHLFLSATSIWPSTIPFFCSSQA